MAAEEARGAGEGDEGRPRAGRLTASWRYRLIRLLSAIGVLGLGVALAAIFATQEHDRLLARGGDPAYIGRLADESFYIVLVSGLVISLLAISVEHALAHIRIYAQIQARRLTKELRESEANLQGAFDATDESVFILDRTLKILAINDVAARRLDRTKAQLMGRRIDEVLTLEAAARRVARIEEVITKGAAVVFEDERAGRKFENRLIPIFDKEGEVARIAIYGRDVTEERELQEKLRASEEHYRLIAEHSGDVIWKINPSTGTIIYVSPSIEHLLGYRPEELVGRPNSLILTEESLARARGYLEDRLSRALSETSVPVSFRDELEQLRKDGSVITTESTLTFIRDENGVMEVLGVTRDVSERKDAERRLRESEERFRALFETSQDAIFITSPEGHVYSANPAAGRMFGCDPEDFLMSDRSSFVDISDPRLQKAQEERARTGIFSGELTYIRADGEHFPGEVSSALFSDRDGMPVASLVIRDITERRNLEREIVRQRDFSMRILELMGQGLTVTGEEGEFEYVNAAFARFLGLDQKSLIGRKPDDFTAEEDRKELERQRSIRRDGRATSYESRLMRADGSLAPVMVTAVPRGGRGHYHGSIAVVTDLSDQKLAQARLEAALADNQRLLHELQHRIKNSFAMILSLVDLSLPQAENEETRSSLEDLASRILAISELYSFLYQSGSFESLRFDEYCAKVISALRSLNRDVEISSRLEAVVVPAGKAGTVGLILSELITNAFKYAWPGKGDRKLDVRLARKGAEAVLEVEDGGVGLPPNFSIASSPGSGLKLAQSLARQIGGGLQLGSSGKGTLCTLRFPLGGSGDGDERDEVEVGSA